MSEQPPPSAPQRLEVTLAEFLEAVPPSQFKNVPAEVTSKLLPSGAIQLQLKYPTIQLHCPNVNCNGLRFFRPAEDFALVQLDVWENKFLSYHCGNCMSQMKIFALAFSVSKIPTSETYDITCSKFGEYPSFGPPTPARLITLIGPDRELFLKGRRSENQGLGIAAFAYYRRVVENQKNRILAQIIKVAETVAAPADAIGALKAAQTEHQFSKAIEIMKDAIPLRLLIQGQNPLILLHSALSKGVHNHSDETCLELATAIRVILVELSDLLEQALKDEQELKEAVARLTRQSGGSA
jgi:hypothetical protein